MIVVGGLVIKNQRFTNFRKDTDFSNIKGNHWKTSK